MLKALQTIRQLYTPVQPTVHHTSGDVCYTELAPMPALRDYVYCYWHLETKRELDTPYTYGVVADGCIDIYFDVTHTRDNYAMGFYRKYTAFDLPHSFNYFGIRFLPTIFPQLFGIHASDISNRSEPLLHIDRAMADFIAREIDASQNTHTIARRLDAYLIKRLHQCRFDFDTRLYEAIDIILKNIGGVNVTTDLDTGFSTRQLRRVFNHYIGDTPKTFCQVVRFQHVLNAAPSREALRTDKLFFDAGYYDQAHFINEFKNFYGVSPSKAFAQ